MRTAAPSAKVNHSRGRTAQLECENSALCTVRDIQLMLTRLASWLRDLSKESRCWRGKASIGDGDWSIEAVIVLDGGGPLQWGAASSRFGAVEFFPFRGSLVWLLNLHHLWSSTARVQAGRPSTSQDLPNCGHQLTISMEQRLTVTQLAEKIIQKIITAFTTARHLSLSWARSIHPRTPNRFLWDTL